MGKTQEHAEKILAFLHDNQEDRGVMADLRCGFSAAKEHRAWPHLAQLCQLDKDWSRIPAQTICAAFATHPDHKAAGNFGATLRKIAKGDQNGKEIQKALKSFEGRFRRLLTCDTQKELCERLPGIIRAAKAKNIPIDYLQLHCDICWWEGPYPPKINWASAFWDSIGDEE